MKQLNLKIIKENLFLEQEPDVLHLRVDSKKNEKNQTQGEIFASLMKRKVYNRVT